MTIQIYSDPHIGRNLASHTTNDSRRRLKEFIALNTSKVIDDFDDCDTVICAGDFYHSHQNDEDVLHSSLWAANKTSKILAGNHDVVNIRDRKGTLDIVSTVFDTRVVPCKFGQINYQVVPASFPMTDDTPDLYLIPHHSSQELFDDALESAYQQAAKSPSPCYLITHCNYNSEFVKDTVTLNLTRRKAERLLKHFHYIVLGHEHNHKTDLDDRVIVVGSPHPTGFGDISDKFIVTMFEDNRKPIIKQVWSKSKHYLECDWNEAVDKITPDHQWIKLTGEVPSSMIHDLASTVKDLWKFSQAFAVKSEVKILAGEDTSHGFKPISMDRINEIIEEELKGTPELYDLWRAINDQGTAP